MVISSQLRQTSQTPAEMERRSSANVNPTHQHLLDLEEDEFIDMDVSSATFFCCSIPSSPPNSKDFEFQMFAEYQTSEKQQLSMTSPADELFYKGKLLPLHLPPRLQMVQKLLERDDKFSESFTTATTTPYMSCQASPSPSCFVSSELDPRFYFDSDCNNNSGNGGNNNNSKKYSWAKKLKLVKKLKASKEYLKSFFSISKSGKYNNTNNLKEEEEEECGHRRSFSGAIKRRAKTKSMTSSSSLSSTSSASSSCSSSKSSSFSSASSCGPTTLKRSSSVGSEVEASIHGAIAHCKKSQAKTTVVTLAARKSVSDVEVCSLSASMIAAESKMQERPEICSL